jgi:hypothetical protein
MLMNLLPGLRDLRAPLAAGYLWLAGLWLLLADIVPPRSTATGVVAHVYSLTHDLGRGVILAAVSFTAYLIGAVLSVDIDGPVVNVLSKISIRRIRGYRYIYRVRQRFLADDRTVGRQMTTAWAYGRTSEKIDNDTRAFVWRIKESVHRLNPVESELSDTKRAAIREWNDSVRTGVGFYAVGSDWAYKVWEGLAMTMLSDLTDEMRQLVTQLRVSNDSLFDQYDRARGEAEFRLSVAFPLIFISATLAWKWTPLWLLLLLGAILIMRSGIKRAREATDVVGQAALTGYVTPSGWMRRDADPLTIAYHALRTASRKRTMYFTEEEIVKVRFILSLLPKPPEKTTDASSSVPS